MRFSNDELDAMRITKEDHPGIDQAGLWLVPTPVDILNALIAQAREANALRAEVERVTKERDEVERLRAVLSEVRDECSRRVPIVTPRKT